MLGGCMVGWEGGSMHTPLFTRTKQGVRHCLSRRSTPISHRQEDARSLLPLPSSQQPAAQRLPALPLLPYLELGVARLSSSIRESVPQKAGQGSWARAGGSGLCSRNRRCRPSGLLGGRHPGAESSRCTAATAYVAAAAAGTGTAYFSATAAGTAPVEPAATARRIVDKRPLDRGGVTFFGPTKADMGAAC